jgi:hypothetical protein
VSGKQISLMILGFIVVFSIDCFSNMKEEAILIPGILGIWLFISFFDFNKWRPRF